MRQRAEKVLKRLLEEVVAEKEGKKVDAMEALLRTMARLSLGWKMDVLDKDGNLVKVDVPPDPAVLKDLVSYFLSKPRHLEISGRDGGPIDILHGRMLQDLSDDELDRVREEAEGRLRRLGADGAGGGGGNGRPKQ